MTTPSDGTARDAAAVIWPSFPGTAAPDWVLRWLERGLGGIVLFAYNTGPRLPELCAELKAVAPNVVLAVDEEGGDVTRLEVETGSSFPGAYALGIVDDVALTREVAAATAAELAAAGVTMNLAPVADVNSNPLNPVIGVRSFGSEPELVARHVAAFVEGTQSLGVAACAKHFPGHGDTHEDSHLALPALDSFPDLAPFRAAVDAGVRAVMTAHVVVAPDEVPATVSPRVLVTLRHELGFQGLVMTDALEMQGLAASAGVEKGAVRALAAGADALCVGHDLHEDAVASIHAEIIEAVRDGRLSEARLAEAARRVAALAQGPDANGAPPRSVGLEGARRAVRATSNTVLQAVGEAPLVVDLVPEPGIAAGFVPYGFGDAARERWPDAQVVSVGEGGALPRLRDGPVLLVLRDAGRHAWQRGLAEQLRAARPDAVVVETGLPDGSPASVYTYGAGRVNLQAAVELLAG
jgi:beta-N-acetylhexosaminidase